MIDALDDDLIEINYPEAIDACLKMCHEYPIKTDAAFVFVTYCLDEIIEAYTAFFSLGAFFGMIHLFSLRNRLAAAEYAYLESIGAQQMEVEV